MIFFGEDRPQAQLIYIGEHIKLPNAALRGATDRRGKTSRSYLTCHSNLLGAISLESSEPSVKSKLVFCLPSPDYIQ